MANTSLGLYNTEDLREGARRRLPKGLFEFMQHPIIIRLGRQAA